MSKSLKPVRTALEQAGIADRIIEVGPVRTAQQAADSVGCALDPRLLVFGTVWPAPGTPRHVFPLDPSALPGLTGATVADFTR